MSSSSMTVTIKHPNAPEILAEMELAVKAIMDKTEINQPDEEIKVSCVHRSFSRRDR